MPPAGSELFNTPSPLPHGGTKSPEITGKAPFLQSEAPAVDDQQTVWRRERDSNPRCPLGQSGFQDRLFQPLTHPSAAGVLFHFCKLYKASLRRLGACRDSTSSTPALAFAKFKLAQTSESAVSPA